MTDFKEIVRKTAMVCRICLAVAFLNHINLFENTLKAFDRHNYTTVPLMHKFFIHFNRYINVTLIVVMFAEVKIELYG